MTPECLVRLGREVAAMVRGRGLPRSALLARDPRRSSPMVAAALSAGLASGGVEVRDAGVLPTPAVSFLVPRTDSGVGVVITASHNPADENGVKLMGPGGDKLDPEWEAALSERLATPGEGADPAVRPGRIVPWPEGEAEYLASVTARFGRSLSLAGLRIGVDAAHGAAFRTTPDALRRLGAEVVEVACAPDGDNINRDCGAVHPELLVDRVRCDRLDLGIAHDGDGDRVVLVTREGRVLDGDDMLFVLAGGPGPEPNGGGGPAVVVGTVMSNEGLARALAGRGISLYRTLVGDRNVKLAMDAHGARYGAEPSGHVLATDLGPTGDGLKAALAVLEAARFPGQALDAALSGFHRYPQVMRNLTVVHRPPLDQLRGWHALLERVETGLAGRGRVLVRYSGTEPKIRVMAEAEERGQAESAVADLCRFLEAALS